MTTITDAIFCYLTNTTEFLGNNRTISTEEYHKRFCSDRNKMDYSDLHDLIGSPRIEYAVVRDPIERFLSGFVDKCINEAKKEKRRCFECKGNMGCFVEKLYSAMIAAQFTKSTKYDYELAHFAPQTWYCNFKDHLHDYIILHYEEGSEGVLNLAKNHDMVYERAGVPKELRQGINAGLLVGSTQHSTSNTAARIEARKILMDSKSLLLRVTQMYYYDFITFHFHLPILL